MKTVNTKFSIIVFSIAVATATACSIQFSVIFVFGFLIFLMLSVYAQCVMNSFVFLPFSLSLSRALLLLLTTLVYSKYDDMKRVHFIHIIHTQYSVFVLYS